MLQADSAATHEDLAKRFSQVNARWKKVEQEVAEGRKRMIEAAQRYEEFRSESSEVDEVDEIVAAHCLSPHSVISPLLSPHCLALSPHGLISPLSSPSPH